jgi:hypothetical protein
MDDASSMSMIVNVSTFTTSVQISPKASLLALNSDEKEVQGAGYSVPRFRLPVLGPAGFWGEALLPEERQMSKGLF